MRLWTSAIRAGDCKTEGSDACLHLMPLATRSLPLP